MVPLAALAGWRIGVGRRTDEVRVVASPDTSPDERLLEAMRSLPVGVVVAEPDGHIVYRNKFAKAFTSGRHNDVLVEAAIQELLAGAFTAMPGERSLEFYGPPRKFLELRATPFLQHDVPSAVVIIEDVTEEHRLDQVRQDFVANVSHELRTPVGAIGVLAETIESHPDDPEVVKRLSRRLQTESARLGSTIEDLLELSWLDAGEVRVPELVPVSEIILLMLRRCGVLANQQGVRLVVNERDSCAVYGSRRQLSAALSNLVENAIKFSDHGSVVSIDVETTADSGDREAADSGAIEAGEDEVIIRVTDHGIGIPASDLDRVFERFYRVDPARSRASGGTGLGLSIVRHAVANHSGTIDLRSAEGEGSTFEMRFPAGHATEAEDPTGEPAELPPDRDRPLAENRGDDA